jgi:hypothetical protein
MSRISILALAALAYLIFDEFDRGPVFHDNCLTENYTTEIRRQYENIPFPQYCAVQWPHHVMMNCKRRHVCRTPF